MKDKLLWECAALAALILVGAWALRAGRTARETAAPAAQTVAVVIDPGHGGEDGGATAPDGTVESAVNLAVALRLDAVLKLCGQDTLLLRDADISLHDPGCTTIRQKKVSDLKNRAAVINAVPNPQVISVHQNCFPSSKYHGAQVFYAGEPTSRPWAELTQENLRLLDGENHRAAAPIPRHVYLMNHITCPAILVECGFLSNPEERDRLKDPAYQTALAAVIAGSYLQKEKGEAPNGTQGEESLLLHPVRQ